MWQRSRAVICSLLACLPALPARTVQDSSCGTHAEKGREELFLHARNQASRGLQRRALAQSAAATNKDYGNVAVMSDADGVIARPNNFNLDGQNVRFVPVSSAAAAYHVQLLPGSFDADASANGELQILGDDDARLIHLPFAFPFFGKTYTSVYVNSDGNATFGESDASSTERSLGRVTAGPPRLAPLFTDLDPRAGAVRVLSEPSRVVVTWDHVPVFSTSGQGVKNTFQLRMYADGAVEYAYNGADPNISAVVGIAPGFLAGNSAVVHFADAPSQAFTGAVAERFTTTSAVDMVTVAQKFYATHEDAYDYLVAYNAAGVEASSGAVAYEVTVRNDRSGYGDTTLDTGAQYGSPRRLQSIINMGPLTQYPDSPTALVAARGSTGDTPITVVAHEAGHLFLAFASVPDPNDVVAKPMLNSRNLAHWAFNFNSEASLLEGNRIIDNGPGSNPRFTTTATVQAYAPLDQYLMGLRAPEEVPDTFVVLNANVASSKLPLTNYSFGGDRLNVSVSDLIAAEGRRTPDHTVSQRRFRFGFILIVPDGQEPSAADIAKVDLFRSEFEKFYSVATSERATADASLRKAVQFSGAPALGVIAGSAAPATVAIAQPATTDLSFTVAGASGSATAPTVILRAGNTSAAVAVTGIRAGVDTLTFTPDDASFETVAAQIQVYDSTGPLSLMLMSGDRQVATGGPLADPIAVKVVDGNRLPYPGVQVSASVTGGGSLAAATATTDEYGVARFRWTPSTGNANELIATVAGGSGAVKAVALQKPAILAGGVANAASYATALAPGGIATLFGTNLAGGSTQAAQTVPLSYTLGGVQVKVNDTPAQLYYVSDGQINFVMPQSIAVGPATINVVSPIGTASATVQTVQAQPGVFYNPVNGFGAILVGNTASTTDVLPAKADDIISIYGTGFGLTEHRADGLDWTLAMTEAQIGGKPAHVLYSGLAPAWPGLYQVNAVVPSGLGTGPNTLKIFVNGIASNEVTLALQ